MRDVLDVFPGARRALFRRHHIGGCSSCGFQPTETLAEVCARNGGLNVDEVIAHIAASHEQDRQLEFTPREVLDRRARGEPVRLLDIRTREEWDAVRIDGAEFVNQELVQSLMGKSPRDALLVFYDHDGTSSLDAAAYFAGHGFTNAKHLRGGIDAWARDVDAKMPRYKLENT
ncbi:MAG: rhodanese-like domain-containing protein [Verrucomicrobia bacterium]|nr:rhodanese-like domain-containing protein [Verrucomicrobiota bacterium]